MAPAPVRTSDGSGRAPAATPLRALRAALLPLRRGWPLVVLAVLVALWAFVAEPLRVTSISMEPTLRSGDHVVLDKLSYRLHPPRRDDLIVFRQPGDGRLVVKRVVGTPGDTVAVEDGVLVVNGIRRAERYVDHGTVDSVYFGPVTVPDGSLFAMGDNRAASIDSRSYGAVDITEIIGRVVWHR